MKSFAVDRLGLDYNILDQGLSKDDNQYLSSRKAPVGDIGFHTFFDFTNEALTLNKTTSVFQYLMFGTFYGTYYFTMLNPHSMYMIACSGFSVLFVVSLINHKMNMALSVADAQVTADGKSANLISYTGSRIVVPIKDLTWHHAMKHRAIVDGKDENGRSRRFIFDFSTVRQQLLVDQEVCMAVFHPDVHEIVWRD